MKRSLILALLISAALCARTQSKAAKKDSAYKYYILLNKSLTERSDEEWRFFSDQYYKYRTECLKQCKTYADSLKYMSDMTDSLRHYKPNLIHSK